MGDASKIEELLGSMGKDVRAAIDVQETFKGLLHAGCMALEAGSGKSVRVINAVGHDSIINFKRICLAQPRLIEVVLELRESAINDKHNDLERTGKRPQDGDAERLVDRWLLPILQPKPADKPERKKTQTCGYMDIIDPPKEGSPDDTTHNQ